MNAAQPNLLPAVQTDGDEPPHLSMGDPASPGTPATPIVVANSVLEADDRDVAAGTGTERSTVGEMMFLNQDNHQYMENLHEILAGLCDELGEFLKDNAIELKRLEGFDVHESLGIVMSAVVPTFQYLRGRFAPGQKV